MYGLYEVLMRTKPWGSVMRPRWRAKYTWLSIKLPRVLCPDFKLPVFNTKIDSELIIK